MGKKNLRVRIQKSSMNKLSSDGISSPLKSGILKSTQDRSPELRSGNRSAMQARVNDVGNRLQSISQESLGGLESLGDMRFDTDADR